MKTNKASVILVWFYLNKDYAPKILLAKRSEKSKRFPGYFAAAGGMVEDGECAIAAAKRELYEETGLSSIYHEIFLRDCFFIDTLKVFTFEMNLSLYNINRVLNKEPKKLSPWKLYDVDEALKLPKLMPNLREMLLTYQKSFLKLETYKYKNT